MNAAGCIALARSVDISGYAAAIASEFACGPEEEREVWARGDKEEAAIEWVCAALERVLRLCDDADHADGPYARLLHTLQVRGAIEGTS